MLASQHQRSRYRPIEVIAGMALAGVFLSPFTTAQAFAAYGPEGGPTMAILGILMADAGKGVAIQGERQLTGVVRKITGEQIEVDAGEVQPRFLSLKESKEKGFSLNPGDKVEMTVNEQNLVVDYHPFHQQQAHKEIKGRIAQALAVGHEQAVIRTEGGREQSYEIRPLARSKVASIPIGASAIFVIDETNRIIDATIDQHAAAGAGAMEKKSPPKGAHKRVEGTIVQPLQSDKIRIRSAGGEERPYDVRPIIGKKLEGMKVGQTVILLIDSEGEVIDVAVPPGPKG